MQSEKSKQLLAEIATSKKEISQIKKELSKKIKANFHGLTKELFNMYPELKSFGWRQYTPYFNDGEACEFRSNHDSPIINGVDTDYDDDDVEDGAIDIVKDSKKTYSDSSTDWKDVKNPNYNSYYKEIVDTLKEFLSQFDNDDMYDLFGDHVTVRITAKKCLTEEYEHD